MKKEPEPEFIPNEDRVITLEHIIPKSPEDNWPEIEPEMAVAMYKRIGNMVEWHCRPQSPCWHGVRFFAVRLAVGRVAVA